MEILSVLDAAFAPYGKVLKGYDTAALAQALVTQTPIKPGVTYVASEPALEALPIAKALQDNAFGGMPMQMGWCNGYNTKLNCLEYHRDSEFNFSPTDFILLLALESEIEHGTLDTAKVKAFRCPAGTLIEVYATTLHYAPCEASVGAGFQVLVALPKGTNTARPTISVLNDEDTLLWARNKWLLAHAESTEAAEGAAVALIGENIDIAPVLL